MPSPALLPGTYTLTIKASTGTLAMFGVTNGAVGPQGPMGLPGAQGVQGPQGVQGQTGAPGPNTIAGFLCPSGSVVIGFGSSGTPVCSCPHDVFTAVVGTIDEATLEYWHGAPGTPAGDNVYPVGFFSPTNSNCSVTVNYPTGVIDNIPAGTPWTIANGAVTGYGSCTIQVSTPNCGTVSISSTVNSNFPTCSNASQVAGGPSTDTAYITCTP